MGLRYFDALLGFQVNIQSPKPYEEEQQSATKTFRLPTARTITLAEYNPAARDAVTAHRLADYRRQRFSLTLLPAVHIWLDDLLQAKEEIHDSV